jgi:hypothetical protein
MRNNGSLRSVREINGALQKHIVNTNGCEQSLDLRERLRVALPNKRHTSAHEIRIVDGFVEDEAWRRIQDVVWTYCASKDSGRPSQCIP